MGNDALAELKPLIPPPPVSDWPPAPGWWILGAVVLAVSIALAIWSWRRWRKHRDTRYQREALALLAQANTVHDVAMLIRRTAISAFGRDRAAATSWQVLCPSMDAACLQLLADAQYRPSSAVHADALARLREQTGQWLAGLPPVRR